MTINDPMTIPDFLQNENLRLILFGGKGGVGKTTMAATAALQLARSCPKDKKVLVVSTDPAHSLSDSFDMPIGNRITPIEYSPKSPPASQARALRAGKVQSPSPNLFARELDASKLLEEFKLKNDAIMKKLADRGTYFDQQDIAEFFDLSLPGMDEVMAIIEIANLLKEGTYDVLILDTAPTGHTVRMLNLPEQMQKWIEVLDLMQHKHRYMATHFTGKKYVKDECDIFLDNLSSDIDRVKKLLCNVETTRFIPVTIPEPMSIYETEKLLSSLEGQDVPVKEIIVNRIAPDNDCAFCRSRREDQVQPLVETETAFSKYDLVKVPLFPNEIRGVEGLKGLADYFSGMAKPARPPEEIHTYEAPQAHLALGPALEFILFGGKGGVGKTTIAAAAALHLAQQDPEKRVLIFSTDPAHSLSDSFNQSIGDNITPVSYSPRSKVQGPKSAKNRAKASDIGHQTSDSTNLFALEIDANTLFEDFKEEFRNEIGEMFDRFLGSGVDVKFDREVMTELLTLAPPGLDEIMALDRIMDLREEGEFDTFVLDTSPTGHLLRFLELPDTVRQWLKSFFRLLLKYKGVVKLTTAAEKALALSKNVRRIQETLVDSQKTAFVAATIPEAMGLLELERLTKALENAKIPCKDVAINMIVPRTECDFCSFKRAEQSRYIEKIHSKFPGRTILQIPLFAHQVRGISDLNKIGGIVFGADQG